MSRHATDRERESARLAERLSRCLGAATWEMDTFCRLAGVEASADVATAAVTCEGRPRLLINPDFVTRCCARDEHLFLLAMHELWHVLLAHTRLYPRATRAQNIAFDAVINAGLARQFPGRAYRGFFERLNPADRFPALLLRPPPGWPRAPRYPAPDHPRGVARVLRALYPPAGCTSQPMPTYGEILDLLRRGSCGGAPVVLLGDHGPEAADDEARAAEDAVLGSVIRRIVGRWPPPPFRIAGRDEGGDVRGWPLSRRAAQPTARAVFGALLRRLLVNGRGGANERRRQPAVVAGGRGVLPNPRDRTAAARRRLGLPVTLWTQGLPRRHRVPVPSAPAHVYLDVSGSMRSVLPMLLDMLTPHVARRRARLFQFSTEVRPLAPADLAAGLVHSTLGTDIDPVLRHVLDASRVRQVIVLTDGYTGTPAQRLAGEIRARHIAIDVVLPASNAWRHDLAGIARSFTVLPDTHSGPATQESRP